MRVLARASAACALAALLACGGDLPPPPSAVVVIVVDTLRADRVESRTPETLAPDLRRWLASGRRYRRAFAPSPWTLPSFASLYTGLFPSRHGAGRAASGDESDFSRLADDVDTLAERLAGRGFATGALVGNPALDPRFGMARGFAHYDYAPATNAFTRRADAVVELALAWIDERGEAPFFLLVHLFDPHMNYDAPPPFRGRYTGALHAPFELPVKDARELRARAAELPPLQRRFIAAAYDEEVAFTTAQVARLLAALSARGLLERGLVVLTSDHGEELFEHEGFEHGHAYWQQVLALPLVVWGAGVQAGDEDAPVSLVDLAPTILAAAGLPPLDDADGVSLWPNLSRGEAIAARALVAESNLYGPERKALIRWPLKLVWDVASGERWLYRLSSDPAESRPLDDEARASALLGELAARVARPAGAPARLPPETERALRELGYLE